MKVVAKNGLLVLIGVFLLMGISYGGNGSDGKDRVFRKNIRDIFLIETGQFDRAISVYSKTIKKHPKSATAYEFRGRAYFGKGQFDRAISDFTKAIEINPQYADAYYYRGLAYQKKRRYDHAISDFTKAIKIKPTHAFSYFKRGFTYYKKGQYDHAASDYTKVIEINRKYGPKLATVYNSRGLIYMSKLGQDKKGCEDLKQACKLGVCAGYTFVKEKGFCVPYGKAKDYFEKGKMYISKGMPGKAITEFSKAIKIKPQSVAAYYNRGLAYQQKGRYDHAISDYTKAIKIKPMFAGSYFNRGGIYSRKGLYDKAISDYTKVIEINPKSAAKLASVYNSRGIIYVSKLKQYKKGCHDLKRACELGVCAGYSVGKDGGICK